MVEPMNWEELTRQGTKDVFLKFFRTGKNPNKADFDKLMAEFEGHENVLVGALDCGGTGQAICTFAEVKDYPSLRFGNPNGKELEKLELYSGALTHDALSAFALGKWGEAMICKPEALKHCTDDEKNQIDSLKSLPVKRLDSVIADGEREVKELEDGFQRYVAEVEREMGENSQKYGKLKGDKDAEATLQKLTDALSSQLTEKMHEKGEGIAAVKKLSGLKWAKAIRAKIHEEL